MGLQKPAPFTAVIFGATGDLAARKLFPALAALHKGEFLPEHFAVVGVGRRDKSDDEFRSDVLKALARHGRNLDDASAKAFASHVYYHREDFGAKDAGQGLGRRVTGLEKQLGLSANRLFYLATDPEFFVPLTAGLAAAGLTTHGKHDGDGWARVIFEKPFGRDQASAVELDRQIGQHLSADQVYRIDHYLGKDTVQNIMAFRFGNGIFEPLFNRRYVDHVQITAAEALGMEGRRGAFYDGIGALRDVVQNHLLQLLALVAMEPPATLKARDLKDSKLQVLRNLVLPDESLAVRGQYGPGEVNGKRAPGYREEEGVAKDSGTETFVALRAEIDSWRWAGVPFLLRAGKQLKHRVTEIAVQFKLPPLRLFRTLECHGDVCDLTDAQPCVLSFRIQPEESICLRFSAKRPGMGLDLHPVALSFDYSKSFHQQLPEAYERLILDALRGDSTLFMRADELEAAWEFVTPILERWQKTKPTDFPNYTAGTWGPAAADRLVEGIHGGWRQP
jgi:glucose-6-phosphate 1-dehydrogenase